MRSTSPGPSAVAMCRLSTCASAGIGAQRHGHALPHGITMKIAVCAPQVSTSTKPGVRQSDVRSFCERLARRLQEATARRRALPRTPLVNVRRHSVWSCCRALVWWRHMFQT